MRALHSFAIASALSLLVAVAPATGRKHRQSQPEQLGFSRDKLNNLTEFFKAEVAAGKVPGAMLLVQRRGQPAYFETFGVRDVATKAPMTPDTLFRIYSMTKPITSVTAMMLVEAGKLRWTNRSRSTSRLREVKSVWKRPVTMASRCSNSFPSAGR